MEANQLRLEKFLSATKTQFVIPIYQRDYNWTIRQCNQLYEDILEVGTNDSMNDHFIGSIVHVSDGTHQTDKNIELTIIDGQQRLTTVTLIYIVLRFLANKKGETEKAEEIYENILINKFTKDNRKLKLRPTKNNDQALQYLLRGDKSEEYNEYSRLIENYNFFKKKITFDKKDEVFKGLSKLVFVEISLERGKDEPQRIFQSLNSTGLNLKQADLIRNYILMALNPKEQKYIYDNYWEYIENNAYKESINESQVSEFIRDFLTIENREISNKKKVYQDFKKKYPISSLINLENNLKHLKTLVNQYNKLLNPQNEPDTEIRKQLEYINNLEINVSFPFLLRIYSDYKNQVISKEELIEVLELIQSFVWRRFILGLPTNALNKIFMTLYSEVDQKEYVKSIEIALVKKRGTLRYPNDNEVSTFLKDKDMYNIKPKKRTYSLERLENFENKEYVNISDNDALTIEHVFPQNPDSSWEKYLTENELEKMEVNLHTMANLTLSGNNGKLGNKSFKEKQNLNKGGGEQGYKYSRLWINRYLREIERWDVEHLEKRRKILTKRFLKIWKYPKFYNVKESESEINIFDIDDGTSKTLDYVIFFDEKSEFSNFVTFYVHIIKSLFDLNPETFFKTDLHKKIKMSSNQKELNSGKPLNDTYYIETTSSTNQKIQLIKLVLHQLELDDVLYIKWK